MDAVPLEMKVERQSLANEVAKRLSHLIQEGHLAPGTRLLESELSRQMGVSRGPLREALRILETMALVDNIPGRGSYVAQLSKQDAQELYSLRTLLEEEAARLAATAPDDSKVLLLCEIYDQLLSAAVSADYPLLARLDLRFHEMVWELAGHKRLKQIMESMVSQIRRYQSLQTNLYQNPILGITDHQEILEAIQKKDPAAAANAMRRHLSIAAQAALQGLPDAVEEASV